MGWKKVFTEGSLGLNDLGDVSRGTLAPIDDVGEVNHYETLMPNVGDWYYRTGVSKPYLYIRHSTYIIHRLNPNEWISNLDFTPALIEVEEPNGGESFYLGNDVDIEWDTTNASGSINIKLLKNDVVQSPDIAAGTGDDSLYAWTIPVTLTPASDYKIYMEMANNSAVNDESNSTFTLLAPTLTITSPNTSVVLSAGATETITWTYNGGYGTVKLHLYKGGSYDSTISSSTPNDGSYDWDIPSNQT